ncbi:MAG: ABC transporter ATP-binding protein [Halobacteriovoraceae bacterium]|nr:ABC transporter ATP-binding protein [Halobacteriovoraceae bacterium]
MSLIEVKNLVKTYGKSTALNNFSYNFEQGKQYAIQGASGSGKSTLLYMIGGLEIPTAGNVYIEGKDLMKLNDSNLAQYRNRFVGFVFQFHYLLSTMKCIDNILLPSKIGSVKGASSVKDLVLSLARKLGVLDCLDKFPYELSGGEQQRINLIRAMSLRPRILLCDEPTGSLDSKNSQNVTELIKGVANELKATLIVVTHDNNVASKFDTRLMLSDGHLI